jgi:hypothetical protein
MPYREIEENRRNEKGKIKNHKKNVKIMGEMREIQSRKKWNERIMSMVEKDYG